MINVYSRIAAILGFVTFFNLFIFHPVGNVAITLFLLGLLVFALLSFKRRNKLAEMTSLISLTIALISSAVLLFVDGPVRIMSLVFLLVFNMLVVVYTLMKDDYPRGILEFILTPLIDIGEYLRGALTILKGLIAGTGWKVMYTAWNKGKNVNGIKSTFFGLLLGLPIVVLLVSLLTKADPIFASFVTNLVSKEFVDEMQMRLIISTFITILFVPIIAMRSRSTYRSPLAILTKLDLRREVTIVMGMVAAVMGLFLALSWPYVFAHVAKETSLAQFGVATYSEYVQKGFAELIKVVGLILGVSWVGLLIYRGKENKANAKWLVIMQGILLFELMIFVVSIARRVGLYTEFHGLSLARIYGMSILIWLSGMTVFMSSRYLRKGKFYLYEILWTVFAVLLTAIINFDNLIIKNPPTVNDRIDYVYLSRLSSDGVKGWISAYSWAKEVVANNSQSDKLYFNADDRREIYYAGTILQNTLANYHRLVSNYGSDMQYEKYYKHVIDSEIISIKDEDKSKQLNISAYDYWMRPGVSGKIEDFSTFNYPISHYYYLVGEDNERRSGLDKILGYSGAKYRAWKKLNEAITLDELLNLNAQYDQVRQKLDKQPKNERYVEVDSSTMSPLLR